MEHSALLLFAIETVNNPSVHVFLGNFLGKRDLSSYKMPLRKNNALLGTCWHTKSITYLFLMTLFASKRKIEVQFSMGARIIFLLLC